MSEHAGTRASASVRARQHKSVTRWRRDVTDGALGSYSEAQGARATSSGGYFALGIHRAYPAPGTGGPGPVAGAAPGRQGRRGNLHRVALSTMRLDLRE